MNKQPKNNSMNFSADQIKDFSLTLQQAVRDMYGIDASGLFAIVYDDFIKSSIENVSDDSDDSDRSFPFP